MAMENQRGQNNFEVLPKYQQNYICMSTLALVNRIRLNSPALWAQIQAEAAQAEKEVYPHAEKRKP